MHQEPGNAASSSFSHLLCRGRLARIYVCLHNKRPSEPAQRNPKPCLHACIRRDAAEKEDQERDMRQKKTPTHTHAHTHMHTHGEKSRDAKKSGASSSIAAARSGNKEQTSPPPTAAAATATESAVPAATATTTACFVPTERESLARQNHSSLGWR